MFELPPKPMVQLELFSPDELLFSSIDYKSIELALLREKVEYIFGQALSLLDDI